MLITEGACDTIWILHLFRQGGVNTKHTLALQAQISWKVKAIHLDVPLQTQEPKAAPEVFGF